MKNSDECKAKPFKDITYMGVLCFKSLYKESSRINIIKIVKITYFSPCFEGHEENALMIE
jgi:hypothetical protein